MSEELEKAKPKEESEEEVKAPTAKLSRVYRFFCWCSGARLYILEQCPTDYNTFFGIGIVIFLTGIMATISGSYAFYTVFKVNYLAAAFGLFWGTLIFFLDWYLVSSLKKQNKPKKELLLSLPRIIFAIFLAVVISKPIELKLFEREIENKIASIQLKKSLKNQKLIDKEFDEIKKLRDDNETMARQIKTKEIYRNKLFDLVITEAEGTAGTGYKGKGPVYKEKKDALDQSTRELEELKKTLLPLIEANTQRIANLSNQKDEKTSQTRTVTENTDGFLARLEAMGKLSDENMKINLVSWFIILMFICIESAPIFVKLITDRGAYDELIDLEVYSHQLIARRRMAQLKTAENKKHNIGLEKSKLEFEAATNSNMEFIGKVASVQAELNDKIINTWKDQEMKHIDENFGDYLPRINQAIGIDTNKETNIKDGSGSKEMAQ